MPESQISTLDADSRKALLGVRWDNRTTYQLEYQDRMSACLPKGKWIGRALQFLASCPPEMVAARRRVFGSIYARWRKGNVPIGQGLPDSGEFGALSYPAPKAPSRGTHHSDGVAQQDVQELLWQRFFSDPTQWWDSRQNKENPRLPDFRHKKSKEALWLDNRCKPAWVETQLAMLDSQVDAERRRHSGSVSPSVQRDCGGLAVHDGDLEVRTCRKLCEDGPVREAVGALNLLVQRGCRIDNYIFYTVLRRCIAEKDLVLGRRIHALSVEYGYERNSFLATHLICLYASHGRLEEAMGVFSKVLPPSAHMWASIISAYARHGEPTKAIKLYRHMQESAVKPDNRVFVAVLKACASARDLAVGKDVHSHIRASAVNPDIFVQTCLIDMYAKCGSIKDAEQLFDGLSQKNVVTWTAMIAGYVQQAMGQEALSLYSSMQQEGMTPPNSVTFICLLQACASVGVACVHQGKQLHAQIEEQGLEADVVVGNSLVNMYAKCGSVLEAQRVFDRLTKKDVVTWNAMIAGYAQEEMGQEAFSLYTCMQQEGIAHPNSVTFVCLLLACTSVAALPLGKQLHAHIEERGLQSDVIVGASLVNMYTKCGSIEDARGVFDRLPQKNVVTWNGMISGYAQRGMGLEALSLHTSMQQEGITEPDCVTFVSLLQACASIGVAALDQGKQLHVQLEERGLQDDIVIGNSLINMYSKCGRMEDAHKIFCTLPHRDVVTWTAMIAGYAHQGMGQEALSLYSNMEQEGITPPNSVTFVCLLQACASVAALPLGKQLHAEIEERGLQRDVIVCNSLVNMYAKCGSMVDSQQAFDSLPEPDSVAWGALIAGYTRHGDSEVVFDLVGRMRQEGIQPNSITLLCVLTVCSHVGLVDKGRTYFEAMSSDYGITPTIDHHTCMIDLLGRAGHLDEALHMIKTMPFEPNSTVWLTLLGACRKWCNVEVGQQAFEFAVRLDGKDAAPYVLMSNIYACAEMWEEAKQMQAKRMQFGAWKEPGQSWWTDMDGVMHSFVVGDRKHLNSDNMYKRLEQLVSRSDRTICSSI